MDNITSYVNWYSDLSFSEKPFNIIDNLVFCNLAYLKYDLNGSDNAFLKDCIEENDSHLSSFRKAVKTSKRFGNVLVSNIKEVASSDIESPTQFYAVTFTYLPKKHFVAFRGTDSTLAGWKEDLMMGYRETNAQEESLIYLDDIILESDSYLVGGHSKGANLALYSCCYLSDNKITSIDHVYLNDGPGLNPETSDTALIEKIKDKCTIIIPEFSVFGKIYEPDITDKRIVRSSQQGILQHNMGSWGIYNGSLIYSSRNTDTSNWVNQVLKIWVENESDENRKVFVDDLFTALTSTGARTRFEIKPDGLKEMQAYWNAIAASSNTTKKVAGKLPISVIFGNFFQEINAGNIISAVHNSITIQGIICTIIGFMMLVLPRRFFDISFVITFFSIVVVQVINMLFLLFKHKRHLRHLIPQAIICAACTATFTILLLKENALFIVESGVSGFILLVWSFRNWIHTKESAPKTFEKIKNLAETVFTFLFGFYILIAPIATMKAYTIILGLYLLLDGLLTAITGQN